MLSSSMSSLACLSCHHSLQLFVLQTSDTACVVKLSFASKRPWLKVQTVLEKQQYITHKDPCGSSKACTECLRQPCDKC